MDDAIDVGKRDLIRTVATVGVAAGAGLVVGRAVVQEAQAQLLESGIDANSVLAKLKKDGVLKIGYAQTPPWFYQDANRTEAIDILVKESGLSRADVEATYDYYRQLHVFDHKGSIESATVGNLIKAMQQMDDFDGPRDIGRFVDPDIAGFAAQVK